jgi:hypothetical protein
MEQTTEKKQYRNAPLADAEYYAKPRWHEVAISAKTGHLILTVLWDVCDSEGHSGNFDIATGAETPLPEGYDGWEAVSKSYVVAYADEAQNLAKCKGKDIEFLKDVCPKTYKAMKHILEWCPAWDPRRVMWFTDNREEFYSNVARIVVIHEEWNGQMRAKAKWTNHRDGKAAKEVDTTEVRGKIASSFGGFFDVRDSAPAPRGRAANANAAPANAAQSAPPAPPVPAPSAPPAPTAPRQCTKNDAWAAYVNRWGASDTTNWFKWIKETGKPEHDFTDADWAALVERIETTDPF